MSHAWRHGVLRGSPPRPTGGRLVVKIGGSLLGRPRWPEAVVALLADEMIGGPHRRRLLVVGGGPVVDGLRAIDAAARQPDEPMHWRAVEALGITARIVADALRLPLVRTPSAEGDGVLDVPAWLDGGGPLPVGWHVTSDSIAAVAAGVAVAGLVLAKSGPPPAGSVHDVAAAGWVDGYFPEAAAALADIAWAAPATPTPAGTSRAEP